MSLCGLNCSGPLDAKGLASPPASQQRADALTRDLGVGGAECQEAEGTSPKELRDSHV